MATIPTAYTWTVGELVTAAKFNQYLRDAISFLLNKPHARLRHSTTQSIVATTGTPVLFNTEDADDDNGHSTVTNTSRYTAQTAGTWKVMATTPWVANGTSKRELYLRKNNLTNYAGTSIDANQAVSHSLSTAGLVDLSVSDYVESWVWQGTAGPLNVTNAFQGGQRMDLIWERT